MLSPRILDERIYDSKRNQVKSSSLLKGHDTEVPLVPILLINL